jgi:hypothetical protein
MFLTLDLPISVAPIAGDGSGGRAAEGEGEVLGAGVVNNLQCVLFPSQMYAVPFSSLIKNVFCIAAP